MMRCILTRLLRFLVLPRKTPALRYEYSTSLVPPPAPFPSSFVLGVRSLNAD